MHARILQAITEIPKCLNIYHHGIIWWKNGRRFCTCLGSSKKYYYRNISFVVFLSFFFNELKNISFSNNSFSNCDAIRNLDFIMEMFLFTGAKSWHHQEWLKRSRVRRRLDFSYRFCDDVGTVFTQHGIA